MSLTNHRTFEIPLKPESYETADQFIKQWLMQKRIDERSTFETMLLIDVVANILKTIEYFMFLIYIIKGNKLLKESKAE